ncbi:hypothetical protein Scep_029400 [Stephania cephalantha]|uniref:Uncharacterized protein n=1 Tax=Stephania cephalantha TaxID=152367 RepID=A0AAP0E591_9MAGN
MATTAKKMTIKLVVDKKANKVLFAVAGKDFVDFLIGLLALPLSSAIRVLTTEKEKMAGCLGELYESVGNLDDIYIQSSVDMANTLRPNAAFSITTPTPPHSIIYNQKYYTCRNLTDCSRQITPVPINDRVTNYRCSSCKQQGTLIEISHINYADSELAVVVKSKKEGFVERAGTYMVMDDLVVKPLSHNHSLKLFNAACMDELAVHFGIEEGLELLRVSMQSKTVLSDVFLSKCTTTQATPGVQIKHEQK